MSRAVAVCCFGFIALFAGGCGDDSDDAATTQPMVSVDATMRAFRAHGVALERVECETPEGFVEGTVSCWSDFASSSGEDGSVIGELRPIGNDSVEVLVLEEPLSPAPGGDASEPTIESEASGGVYAYRGNTVVLCSDPDCGGQLENIKASLRAL